MRNIFFKQKLVTKRQTLKIYLSLSFLVCFGWLVLGQNNKASAAVWNTSQTIGNVAPLPNTARVFTDKTQTNFVKFAQPSFVVGNGIFDGNYAWLKIYVPVGQSTTVTIQNGGGFCPRTAPQVNDMMDANTLSGNTKSNPNVDYFLYDLDSSESEFSRNGITYGDRMNSQLNRNGTLNLNCRDMSFNTIPAGAGVASAVYGHTQYRVFAFLAHMINCPDALKGTCVHDVVKEFRLMSSNVNSLIGTSRAINASTDAGSPYGVVYDTPPDNFTWDYTFQFAPRCNETRPSNQMFIYDMDTGNETNQQPTADLYNDDKTQAGLQWNLQNHYTAVAPTWQLGQPVDHSSASVNYTSDPNDRIRFDFIDIAQWNRIEDYTGFDQFDAGDFVCYAATCDVISLDPASANQEAGKDIQIQIKTHNTGVAPWPTSFYLGDITGQDTDKHNVSPQQVNQGGDAFFTFIVSEENPGNYTYKYQMHEDNDNAFGEVCTVNLTFTEGPGPIVVACDTTRVSGVRSSASGDVQARLSFTRLKGSDDPGSFNYDWSFKNDGGNYSFNTFGTITQLFPHQPYRADFYVKNSNGVYQKRKTVNLPQCLTVSCFGSVAGADVEPGQSSEITYGVTVVNDTTLGFDGYTLHLSNPDGGIDGVRGSPILASLLDGIPGRSTDVSDTFSATFKWQGHLQADFFYKDTNLSNVYSVLPCSDQVTPKTRPFLKVLQGDVSTGGSFEKYDNVNKSASCPNVGAPDYISPPDASNLYPGGIRTFSTPDDHKGSSADFAAYSLGLIYGDESGPDGFYSSDINGGGENNFNTLSFANSGVNVTGTLGGLLGGNSPSITAHCMTDLFDTTRDPAVVQEVVSAPVNISSPRTEQRYFKSADGSPVEISVGQINPGNRLTVYVDGDVFITNNIKYAGQWTPDRIAYFALIVKGNITVAPNVTSLDGLYVAQPLNDSSKGIFQTCSVDGSTNLTASQISNNCKDDVLTLNGAVMARRVTPVRAFSTMWNGDPAEKFNFSPSMVLGVPNLYSTSGAVIPSTLLNLLSLPPVF